jgi:hypothetical protein
MKLLDERDFKLVILVCPTAPELEDAAFEQVLRIVREVGLNAETYLFTAGDLRDMAKVFAGAGLDADAQKLLCMSGYANVRNMCLLAASILSSDVTILIDDDEVFESPDFISRATEFIGKRVYGDVVHGVAGYYLNKDGKYYDDVKPEAWMAYWNRFEAKTRAFDKIIGSEPRIKRTPFAFGGAIVLHRELFECVPFDPMVPRGEDVDYLINGRMYGFSFFLDNTLSIKHLPEPKSHPQWMRLREDIYRFVYQREKMTAQTETGTSSAPSPSAARTISRAWSSAWARPPRRRVSSRSWAAIRPRPPGAIIIPCSRRGRSTPARRTWRPSGTAVSMRSAAI